MRVNDAVIGILAILLGIIVFFHVQDYPTVDGNVGPGLFPSALAILMCIAGACLIVRGIKSKAVLFAPVEGLTLHGFGNILITIGAILFYIFLSEVLGFIITSFCVMFGLMLVLKAKPVIAAPVALGMTLFIYTVFSKGLLVPLPRGFIYF